MGGALVSVWRQALVEGGEEIKLEAESFPATRSRTKKFLMIEFKFGAERVVSVEQNPKTGSRWAALAPEGKRVKQFPKLHRQRLQTETPALSCNANR